MIDEAAEAVCVYEDSEPSVDLVVDQGYLTVQETMTLVRPVVAFVAENGGDVAVRVVGTGNAAASGPLPLASVNGGSLHREACNDGARHDEALANTDAVLDEIETALAATAAQAEANATGRDLLGALEAASRRVVDSSTAGGHSIVLVTGGGVHQTADRDLIAAYSSGEDGAFSDVPALAAGAADIVIVGAGAFPGIEEPPPTDLSAKLRAFWDDVCAEATAAACRSVETYRSER